MVVTPESAVALMTGGLAIATFWLAWEGRAARRQAREEESRHVLRAALAEQLDNCRAWASGDPARGQSSIKRLRDAEPRAMAVAAMINRLDLPPDLLGYLIWLTSAIGEGWGRIDTLLERVWSDGIDSIRETQLRDEWRVMVERLQVLAALTAGEARRRGLGDIAETHDAVPWTIVSERPERWRESMTLDDNALGRPSFPVDPSFESASPTARDRAGAVAGERQGAVSMGAAARRGL